MATSSTVRSSLNGLARRLVADATRDAEAGNLPAATHKLFRSLLLQDAEQTREQLAAILERTGESERVQAELDGAVVSAHRILN